MKVRQLIAAAIAAALFGCAGAAWSASPLRVSGNYVSAEIGYGDLDVHSPQDARTLIARVQQAAKHVCAAAAPEEDPIFFVADVQDYRRCLQASVDRAIDQLNVPEVTAVYRETRLAQVWPTP